MNVILGFALGAPKTSLAPPAGFVFLLDAAGNYLVDVDGSLLLEIR